MASCEDHHHQHGTNREWGENAGSGLRRRHPYREDEEERPDELDGELTTQLHAASHGF
jgi:hypothetical protein